jgi:ribonuclease T1
MRMRPPSNHSLPGTLMTERHLPDLGVVSRVLLFWFVFVLTSALTPAQALGWFSPGAQDEITVAQMPPEGRHTLALIKQGGPFPYSKDGTVFRNREGLLPQQSRGYYREYTVNTPGLSHRGARRIVAGGGQYWYTADHYRSFKRIRE